MRKLALFFAAMLQVVTSLAQEKSSSFNFLKLPASAHAAALGGINISLIDDDATLAFNNPAMLASVSDKTINLNYMSYMKGSLVASAALVKAIGDRHTLGINAQYLNYGSMDETDENGNVTGDLSAKDFSLAGQYSYSLSERWVGGATARFIFSKYAEYSSFAIAFDLGLNYFNEENDFSASITMRNVGAQLKRFDDRTEHLPFDLDVGFTQSMAHAPVRLSLTLTDLTRWSSKYYFNESGKECSFGRILFNHFVIGVDVIPTKFLYLSAGYNARRAYELKAAGSGKGAGWSFGGGLKLSRFKLGVAYSKYHVAASSILVNLSYGIK